MHNITFYVGFYSIIFRVVSFWKEKRNCKVKKGEIEENILLILILFHHSKKPELGVFFPIQQKTKYCITFTVENKEKNKKRKLIKI